METSTLVHAAFDPRDPVARADPYSIYRALRERDPVCWSDEHESWVLTRYEDVAAVLRDPVRFASDFGKAQGYDGNENVIGEMMRRLMLFRDPPDHTRLRTLVNKAFTPRRVEGLRARVESVVDELLDAAAGRGRMEVMADLAFPLPVIVIGEVLGIPYEDRDRFRDWTRVIARTLDPLASEDDYQEVRQTVGAAAFDMFPYFYGLVTERRQRPRDDLISALCQAEHEGDALSEEELLSMIVLLLVAGHETTMNLIGNGLYALLRNPAQIDRLRDDPSLARHAVEELLRYDAPVQLTARTAMEPVEIDGRRIGERQELFVLLGAANRDPDVFEDPERLDVTRTDVRHLSFSGGPHFCVGAPLARLEAEVAFGALARRFARMELAAEPEWRETITLRGLKSLEVTLG